MGLGVCVCLCVCVCVCVCVCLFLVCQSVICSVSVFVCVHAFCSVFSCHPCPPVDLLHEAEAQAEGWRLVPHRCSAGPLWWLKLLPSIWPVQVTVPRCLASSASLSHIKAPATSCSPPSPSACLSDPATPCSSSLRDCLGLVPLCGVEVWWKALRFNR